MALLPDQIDDFVNLTLDNFKKKSWVDLSLDLQEYKFASKMFKKKGKSPEKGGVQLNWKIQDDNTGTATWSEMYAVDQTGVKDLTTEAKQPWAKSTTNFSYDIDEDLFQSDRETIIREIQIREHSMYSDFFELMEAAMWGSPTSDTQSPRRASGIPFWIQKDASTTPGGAFNGGDPSGFSGGAAGINVADVSGWKNWTFGYTSVSRDDFVKKLRKACEFTHFKAPHSYSELGGAGESNYGLYTTYRVLEALERLLESRNDNLGVDLNKYAGAVLMKGNIVDWVPYLEANDTSDPIYGVCWDVLKYFFKKGANMRRTKPQRAARQNTVREVHMDNWGNFACYNRRRTFVGSIA